MTNQAIDMRLSVLDMALAAGSGHIGGSFSAMEILKVLYEDQMRVRPKEPLWADRDRLVLSKGHAAPALYVNLARKGFFDAGELTHLRELGHFLQGHPCMFKCPGVDMSTGSLGLGLSVGVGMALSLRDEHPDAHVYVILGDGELQEGLVWEAAMSAAHYKLDNLTYIVDNNGLQIDGSNDQVMGLGNIAQKFTAFGFRVMEVADGNDLKQVLDALHQPAQKDVPTCILCHTVKGKGVSFMENQIGWHGKAPNAEQRDQALKELEA